MAAEPRNSGVRTGRGAPSSVPPPGMPGGTVTPVVDDGLFMISTEHLLMVRIDGRLNPASFERYRREWLASVDKRTKSSRVGAFYDIPEWGGFSARLRMEWAAMLKSREEILRRTTVGMVLVTPSLLVRGAMNAVYWLAPPPFPYHLCENLEEGWGYMSKRVDALDPSLAFRAYNALVEKYVPPRTPTVPPPRATSRPPPPLRKFGA